jgi:hypothetical protein
MMNTLLPDPIEIPSSPDRVYYEIGTLLAAEDFNDEQAYHRGRLACALSALHGGGTIAGLKVSYVAAANGQPEELQLSPGLALDRFGRLIEVPRTWCIRLANWYQSANPKALQVAHDGPNRVVNCDLYIRFVTVERGRTPAFAKSTFDSLNATAPSRQRDAFFIELVPRTKLTLPEANFEKVNPGMAADDVKQLLLDMPYGGGFDGRTWAPLPEHEGGIDTRNVFLARIPIPADPGVGDKPPGRIPGNIVPNNLLRRFVVAPAVLARLSGL